MATTPRLQALQNLSNQLPVANQQLAANQSAARNMQLQAAIKAAPVGQATTATAQQTGAAAATQAGQQAVTNAQQLIQQQGQVGQLGLAEQQRQNEATTASGRLALGEQSLGQVERFAKLNESLKKQLYDETMKFQTDELGRTKFNEMQLADYYRSKAVNDEQFRSYQQQVDQASKRRLQMMEQAHKLLSQDLQNQYEVARQHGDQHTALEIQKQQQEAAAAMQREKNRAANRAAAWSAGGTVLGGAAGAAIGRTPQAAAAGGGIGQAVGGGISGITGG